MKNLALAAAIILTLCRCTSAASAQQEKQTAAKEPVILSPADKQHVGVKDDPLCENDKPCLRIRVEGRVAENMTPFLAVEPVAVSPRMWIQPRIHKMKRDGSFSGLIRLGEAQNGARQYFHIYLFACQSPSHFREGDEIVTLPSDCAVSDPVEVFRER